jgi:hypothetical protein
MTNIKNVSNGLNALSKLFRDLEKTATETSKTMVEGMKAIDNQAQKNLDSRKKLTGASEKQRKEITAEQKEAQALIKAKQQLTQASLKQAELTQRLRKNKQDLVKAQKLEIQAGKGQAKTYEQLSARYIMAAKRAKDLAVMYGTNNKKARQAAQAASKYNDELKKIDKTLGNHQRNVGNYTKQLDRASKGVGTFTKTLAGMFAVVGGGMLGFQTLTRALGNAFKTIRGFSKESAVLSGVLGVTRKETKALQEEAQRLGALYPVMAQDVLELETAYARLGFSQKDILNLTEATVLGSIAMNSELAETAELTGAVVNSFDEFTTIDAPEIMDIMTASTNKSALSFEKLQTALPIVAGAANAAGVQFTELVSLLGKLSDAGIDTSSSANSLKNIFIESSAQGLSYDQILDKIIASQDKLTTANDEFGKRAAVSALTLAKNIDGIRELDTALQNAGGTAKEVAEEQMRTLDGAIKGLESAYEALVLSFKGSEGVLSNIINSFTALLRNHEILTDVLRQIGSEYIGAAEAVYELFEALGIVNDETEKGIGLFKTLGVTIKIASAPVRLIIFLFTKFVNLLTLIVEKLQPVIDKIVELAGVVANVLEPALRKIQDLFALVGHTLKRDSDEIGAFTLEAQNNMQETTKVMEQEAAKQVKISEEKNKKLYDNELKLFEQQQQLDALRFKNAGATQEEIEDFKLKQTLEGYQKRLELAKKFSGVLGETEKQIISAQISEAIRDADFDDVDLSLKKLNLEVEELGLDDDIDAQTEADESFILEQMAAEDEARLKMHRDMLEEQKKAEEEYAEWQKETIASTYENIMETLTNFADQRVEQADRIVEAADREVDSAERNLDRQIALAEAGYANNVADAQKQLELQKQAQQAALEEQRRAVEAKQRLETIEQGVSLITASANIIKGFSSIPVVGVPLGIAAVAAMLAAFISTKAKAKSASKEFADGGYIDLEGGSHASGNDIHFGNQNGTELRAEGGEGAAIFNKKTKRKYGSLLPKLVNDANKLKLEDNFNKSFDTNLMPIIIEKDGEKFGNLNKIEYLLGQIYESGKNNSYIDSKGRRVEQKGNVKRITR